ncbi:hypothetical protein SprV_0200714900 [Sparganum proliferum]
MYGCQDRQASNMKTNLGLAMTYLAALLSWPNIIVYSVHLASKVGILSPIAYTISTAVTVALFALVLLEMRTKAPGAKTFPQVVRCRFGTAVHIIVVFAFLVAPVFNVMQIINSGCSILDAATEDANSEKMITCLFMFIAACVVFVEFGNFRHTLYVTSIFILAMAGILGMSIFNDLRNFPLGNEDRFYKLLDCYTPDGAEEHISYLSAYNVKGLWAVWTDFLLATTQFFLCQTNWMSGIALTLDHSSLSFILAALVIFSIPFLYSTCLGLGYVALRSATNVSIIGSSQWRIDPIVLIVPVFLYGRQGLILQFVMTVIMTVVSCSCFVCGGSSILIHDVLQIYVREEDQQIPPPCS